jgi:hypothetical protein
VGDKQQGNAAGKEHIFHPGDGVDVQVVCGFVQQQQGGFGGQGARQQHSTLLAAGEFGEIHVGREAGFLDPAFGFQFDLPIAVLHVVGGAIADDLGHGSGQRGNFLREVGDAGGAVLDDFAGIRFVFSQHHAHEGAFSGAVAAGQADSLTLFQGETDRVQQRGAAESEAHVAKGKDGHGGRQTYLPDRCEREKDFRTWERISKNRALLGEKGERILGHLTLADRIFVLAPSRPAMWGLLVHRASLKHRHMVDASDLVFQSVRKEGSVVSPFGNLTSRVSSILCALALSASAAKTVILQNPWTGADLPRYPPSIIMPDAGGFNTLTQAAFSDKSYWSYTFASNTPGRFYFVNTNSTDYQYGTTGFRPTGSAPATFDVDALFAGRDTVWIVPDTTNPRPRIPAITATDPMGKRMVVMFRSPWSGTPRFRAHGGIGATSRRSPAPICGIRRAWPDWPT